MIFRTVITHHPPIKRIITHHCVICRTKRALHAAVHKVVIALLPVVYSVGVLLEAVFSSGLHLQQKEFQLGMLV